METMARCCASNRPWRGFRFYNFDVRSITTHSIWPGVVLDSRLFAVWIASKEMRDFEEISIENDCLLFESFNLYAKQRRVMTNGQFNMLRFFWLIFTRRSLYEDGREVGLWFNYVLAEAKRHEACK